MVRRIPFKHRRMKPTSYKRPGSSPGMLTASPEAHPSEIYVLAYGPDGYIEHQCKEAAEISEFIQEWPVVWVHVVGLSNVKMIGKIGEMFSLERLLLEDVLDTSGRAKVEYYDQYIFTTIKRGQITQQVGSEQISIFLKKNLVIVFEEQSPRSFDQVRARVRRGTGKIRQCGTDYLYYALLDEMIDNYFPVLDKLNHQLVQIEDEIMSGSQSLQGKDAIQQIHTTKSDLLLLHRMIWPTGDIINTLIRQETPLVTKNTRTYLRDCYDHCIQANELTQFYRDMASGLLNTFLAYEGHKTNEIVKVLTMISAVFIPLTFISGLYGMNFNHADSPYNMPELHWRFGYPFVLALMASVALGMLVFFRRRGWLGANGSSASGQSSDTVQNGN
ncbi:MAG: magnesium/cobalt transporter CorA [Alphaproteobacteria bacterium]